MTMTSYVTINQWGSRPWIRIPALDRMWDGRLKYEPKRPKRLTFACKLDRSVVAVTSSGSRLGTCMSRSGALQTCRVYSSFTAADIAGDGRFLDLVHVIVILAGESSVIETQVQRKSLHLCLCRRLFPFLVVVDPADPPAP